MEDLRSELEDKLDVLYDKLTEKYQNEFLRLSEQEEDDKYDAWE